MSNTHPPQEPAAVPISITICGDGGCGKSSITLRLVRSQWTSEYDPTIEDSYSVTRRIDGTTYHLSLTDTAGQEEYRGMWASSNLGADAFLMVYDITNRDTLEALQYFDDLIDMEAETRLDNAERVRKSASAGGGGKLDPATTGHASGTLSGTHQQSRTVQPVKMIAGNKCDLQESREVFARTGLEWARKRGSGFMETSARLEVNIEETFALIVRRVMDARKQAAMEVSRPGMNARNMTAPLSPLPPGYGPGSAGANTEKYGAAQGQAPGRGLARGPDPTGVKVGRGQGSFWHKMRCW